MKPDLRALAAAATALDTAWVDAVRNAKVPDEYAHLDAELK
jgi:hypothetical protein